MLADTIDRAGFVLPADGWYGVAVGHAAALQLHVWLELRPDAHDHRAVVSLDDPLPAGLHALRGSSAGVLGTESLRAGRRLRAWLRRLQPDLPLVAFVSGDGLLVADNPRPGVRSAELVALAADAGELPPHEAAAALAMASALKGSGALIAAGPRPVLLVIQSDLRPGSEAWVAGGPFEPGPFPDLLAAQAFVGQRLTRSTANLLPSTLEAAEARLAPQGWQGLRVFAGGNRALLQMVAQLARREGLSVEVLEGALDDTPAVAAARLAAAAAKTGPDLIIAGGHLHGREPSPLATLALHWGSHWKRPAPPLLAAAASGRDGKGPGGGAWWLPGPWDPAAAEAALAVGDAAAFFRRQGWLLPRGEGQAAVGSLALILRRTDKLRVPE